MPTQRTSNCSSSASKLVYCRALPKVSATQRKILRFVVEQGSVPFDQLVRFVAQSSVQVEKAVAGLEREQCLVRTAFSVDPQPWFNATRRGGRCVEVECWWVRRPGISSLNHRRGINEARLELEGEFSGGGWISERELLREGRPEDYLPDGVFKFDGALWAIEVELTRKNRRLIRRKVAWLLARYDKVIYFCADMVRLRVSGVQSEFAAERFEVRSASGTSWREATNKWTGPVAYRPSQADRKLLRLVSEEGVVAVDQLSALLGSPEKALREQLAVLEKHQFVESGFRGGSLGGWVRCTWRGNEASESGLANFCVNSSARLPRRRALMALRLALAPNVRSGRWLTRRMLGREEMFGASLEMAVLERRGRRMAIVVSSDVAVRYDRVRGWMPGLSEQYDGVWWYCAGRSYDGARRLVEFDGWSKVDVRRMPEG